MATQCFLSSAISTTNLANQLAKLNGVASGWATQRLAVTRGGGVLNATTNTVAGTTNGVECVDSSDTGSPLSFISPPVSADVAISGAITGNIWAQESSMSANTAINFLVEVIRATDNSIVQIVKSARTTELGFSGANTVQNFTATPGAAVTVNKGDRIRVRIFGDDAGTMANGFTFTIGYNGTTINLNGDTYISFTETFSFSSDTTDPAGSTVYLTDTASDVSTASVDREAWTSRGAGVQTDVTNSATAWPAAIQTTDTAGGTVVDWFTKQLQAFTLGGIARVKVRVGCDNTAISGQVRVELARVDSNGTNPSVWGSWVWAAPTSALTINVTTETEYDVWVSGDDLTFADGQRIRVRIYLAAGGLASLVTGHTLTNWYAGTSGGASGDSFVILPQAISEFVTTRQPRNPAINHQNPAVL